MQDRGFTLLEVLMVLVVIALLALAAMPNYEGNLRESKQQVVVEQMVRMINLARQTALQSGGDSVLCPFGEDGCGLDWSAGMLLITNDAVLRAVVFEHDAVVILKSFPAGNDDNLTFASDGFTQVQNGSFYYCPIRGAAQRIVFNQAGRVYVTDENADDGCG